MNAYCFDYSDSESWFVSKSQRDEVCAVIYTMAEDKYQEECRYLMRLRAHLAVTNFHYNLHLDLERHVSPKKLQDIEGLFRAIHFGHHAVDEWIKHHRHLRPTAE